MKDKYDKLKAESGKNVYTIKPHHIRIGDSLYLGPIILLKASQVIGDVLPLTPAS